MIDITFWLVKIVLFIASAVIISTAFTQGNSRHFGFGLTLCSIPFYMTGVELISGSVTPWSDLILSGSEEDLRNAFFGGVLMLMLAAFLLVIIFKHLSKTPNQNSELDR